MFCREHVAQLRDHEDELAETGATVVAVGTGGRRYARAFAESHDLSFPLLVDPELVSYRVVGARRGKAHQLASQGVIRAGLRALRGGNRQGRTGPHWMMLGATHVLHPDGSVPYAWINDDFGDNAPIPDVLAALR